MLSNERKTREITAANKRMCIDGTKAFKGLLLPSEKVGQLMESDSSVTSWRPWSEGGVEISGRATIKAKVVKK